MKRVFAILALCAMCGCTVNRTSLLYKRTRAKQQLAPPKVFADGQSAPKNVVTTTADTTQTPKRSRHKKIRTHEKN